MGWPDFKWYRDHLPEDGSAQIFDLTSSWTTLGLWGPRARDILGSLTGADVSHEGFPFATCETIEMGPLRVLASRISYVGDLGWELYVPIEQGARLWDMVAEAGEPHGIVPGGHRRLRHHRPAREVLPRVRLRARRRVQRRRGRHGVGQGQGPGLRRQGGARAPPRGGAGDRHVHADGGRPHLGERREALHARRRADRDAATASGSPTPTAAGRTSRAPAPGPRSASTSCWRTSRPSTRTSASSSRSST